MNATPAPPVPPPLHPLLDQAAARELEARVLGGDARAEWAAMRRAGRAIGVALDADLAFEAGPWPEEPTVLVLAGAGHNGGDALLAAAELVARHPRAVVTVVASVPFAAWKPLTQRAWEVLARATGGRTPLRVFAGDAPPRGVAVPRDGWTVLLDGLLGMAAAGPLRAPLPALLRWVATLPALARVAVDLPTGLVAGDAATFRADFTYATGSVKAPVAARAAVDRVGRLRYLDLGFFDDPVSRPDATAPGVLRPCVMAPWTRLRPAGWDKRAAGHVLLIGGSEAYPGAIQLAARAALRVGAGLVTAALPERFCAAAAAAAPEIMWRGLPTNGAGALDAAAAGALAPLLERADVLVLGPGLGGDPSAQELTARVLAQTNQPVVLDADALQPAMLDALRRGTSGRTVVLTPHDGEAKRLGLPVGGALDADVIAEATAQRAWAAAHPGMVVIRKGPATRVYDATRWGIAAAGGPWLARGGSGDRLAGWIGAWLATGEDPWVAVAAAVLAHAQQRENV